MFSTFPSTPRSRFSKALPVVPDSSETEIRAVNMAMSVKSDLPPLPLGATIQPNLIPRRPVGAPNQLPKSPSVESLSSVYSDSPGLSRTHSTSSTKESLSIADSEAQLPTPPPKDKEERQTTNILDSPSSFNGSPTRPELWKRRSIRSEKNIQVDELKLTVSNGSTASPPRRQNQTTERPLPRSITSRKPIPARPAPPQPDFMGKQLSKLENKLDHKLKKKLSSRDVEDEAPQQAASVKRPPTPEYPKADKQQPATPQVLSPISPYTPPEETVPPQLPPKSEGRANSNSNPRPTMSDTEIPNLLSAHSRESSDTLTITSEAQVIRSPKPQKSFGARILTPQPSPDKESSSPHNLDSPAAHSTYFPTIPSPAAPGTIFPGPPLDIAHFDCYQSHRYMRCSRNAYYPVGCMICLRKDAETRWRCTWCCLSACGSCMQVLSSVPGKDLRICLEHLGHKG